MPGPIPRRSSERRRENKPDIPIIDAPELPVADIQWPEPDAEWGPTMTRWYMSLRESPMARFYVETDVSQAWVLAEVGNRMLNGAGTRGVAKGISGQLFAAWVDSTADLGTTEGARRRLRIELERHEPLGEPHSVIQLNTYRKRLDGTGAP